MNALKAPSGAEKPFIFNSTEGHALCRRILKELLPYDPHDVQIEGICKVTDNIDLFAVLATGSGRINVHASCTSNPERPIPVSHCKIPRKPVPHGYLSHKVSGTSDG